MTAYPKLKSASSAAEGEEAIVDYWERTNTFRRSVEERPASRPFVFYEGPPTANGRPGVHHVIARLCKDLICRYKTMTGHRVVRKGGWDTHGLPVEIEVERELGITHKEEIEKFGVAEFNRRCRESVFRYEKEWVRFTRRIGYWVDMEDPYVTCDNRYIESVWWIIAEFWKKGLLYQGHKIVPYCPRCETSLSSHEVSQGYKDVADPSVFVKFARRGADEFFLVWTTTPWTLVSNVALAVGPDHEYARVRHNGETLILASALLSTLDGETEVVDRFKGSSLVGAEYEPLFDFFADTAGAFRVVPAGFVSLDDGTGIVHIAPAFGEDDYSLHRQHGLPLIQAVTSSGTFDERVTKWVGQFVKDADPAIIRELKEQGKLYRSTKITHSYPFCWRCATPLIYYARRSWYIETTKFKDRMIEANRVIRWIPKEVGQYRFGNWLENNVDWSLSRERYWGTPLNIWTCESCDHRDAVGSIEELRRRACAMPAGDLDLHRPYVDEIEFECEKCGGAMKRVKEVVDVWFDSGCMPFAQYHYPWDEQKIFDGQFPADYISEGIDQCRGWFYSLLAIAVMLRGEASYRSCLTVELILDKHGQKMSKSKGNTVDPWELLGDEGADAMRWYLVTTSPPWAPTRFDRDGVRETSRKMLDTLRNTYSFFSMYASIDGYEHDDTRRGEPSLLDRWILSRYHTVARRMTEFLDGFDVTRAARLLQSFVLDELSNWYVRRSRRRFWKGEKGPDKVAAYHTLYTVLDGVARLMAPFAPFVADELFLALRGKDAGSASGESVHLAPYPQCDDNGVDAALESQMEMALAVASLGRTVRNDAAIRTRQPLSEILIHSEDGSTLDAFVSNRAIVELVLEELNVRTVAGAGDLGRYVRLSAKPNFPVLGKRFGKKVPLVQKAIQGLETAALLAFNRSGAVTVTVDGETAELTREELTVSVDAIAGYGASEERGVTVVLNLAVTPELKVEGDAREIINRVQNLRKQSGFEVTDRIRLSYHGSASLAAALEARGDLVRSETLAVEVRRGKPDWPSRTEFELDGESLQLWIQKTS